GEPTKLACSGQHEGEIRKTPGEETGPSPGISVDCRSATGSLLAGLSRGSATQITQQLARWDLGRVVGHLDDDRRVVGLLSCQGEHVAGRRVDGPSVTVNQAISAAPCCDTPAPVGAGAAWQARPSIGLANRRVGAAGRDTVRLDRGPERADDALPLSTPGILEVAEIERGCYRGQNADDQDHDEQFDQGEAP